MASAEANFAGSPLDEADTVRVETLVDTGGTTLGASQWDITSGDTLLSHLAFTAVTPELDDGSLHGELDKVEGEEPNYVPDPDNTDPTARDGGNVGELPVGVGSDDGRHELSDTESTEQCSRGTFHEEESMRTGDEDQSLGDDGNLEVDNHVDLRGVGTKLGLAVDSNAELVLEEVGLHNDNDKGNPMRGLET